MKTITWQPHGLEQTHACAALAAQAIPQPLAAGPFIVFLKGALGAGKTSFTQGLLAALGIREPVRSPTFNLVWHYEIDDLEIHHMDAYRLQAAADCLSLGLDEWLMPGHLILVEWPERIEGAMRPDWVVTLKDTDEGASREIELSGVSPLGIETVKGLSDIPHSSSSM